MIVLYHLTTNTRYGSYIRTVYGSVYPGYDHLVVLIFVVKAMVIQPSLPRSRLDFRRMAAQVKDIRITLDLLKQTRYGSYYTDRIRIRITPCLSSVS